MPVLSCTKNFGCSEQCVHAIDFISLVIPTEPEKLSCSCAVNAHKEALLGASLPVRQRFNYKQQIGKKKTLAFSWGHIPVHSLVLRGKNV